MFCPYCGNEIQNGSAFCTRCGARIIQPGTEGFQERAFTANRPSPGIELCDDGKYRWYYELNMWKNPMILSTTFKVFGMTAVIIFLIMAVISLFDNGPDGIRDMVLSIWDNRMIFILVILLFVVMIFMAYGILAIMYGGKYIVLFEMDEKGVYHKQQPKQFQKAQAAAWMSALASAAAGDAIGGIGRGLALGSMNAVHTSFSGTSKCRPRRRYNAIRLSEGLMQNQIYAADEDYDFVLDYITRHIPEKARR